MNVFDFPSLGLYKSAMLVLILQSNVLACTSDRLLSLPVRYLNLIDFIEYIFELELYLQPISRMWPFLIFVDILRLLYRSFRMLMLAWFITSSHVTPLLRSVSWLPAAARIKFRTLILIFQASDGSGPHYLCKFRTNVMVLLWGLNRLIRQDLRVSVFWLLRELYSSFQTALCLSSFCKARKTHIFRRHGG